MDLLSIAARFSSLFVARERELRAKDSLQPGEAEEFHALHRLFVGVTELGSRIWDFSTSRTLAEHLQISGHIIDSVCGPSASDTVTRTRIPTAPNHPPPQRPRSPDHPPPRSSSSRATAIRPSAAETGSSRDRSRSRQIELGVSRLIQSDSAEEAVAELLETHCVSGSTLAIFDCHGVLDKDLRTSCAVVSDLSKCNIEVACLSFARKPSTISEAHSAVSWVSQQARVDIPFIVTPRPVSWLCRDRSDWCKGHFLSTLIETEPRLRIFYCDDRWDILRDVRNLTRASEKLRLVHCDENTSVAQAVAQWSSAAKGSHFRDSRDVRVVRHQD